jgi:hypothetical protein
MDETVTIKKSEYENLLSRSQWLAYLSDAGVDNWQGFSHAADNARANGDGEVITY